MLLKTQYEFLFAGRDEGSFVENYVYDLGESNEESGKVFINLEIQNNPADAEAIGETIFDSLRKGFFHDLEKDPYGRFEVAIKSVNKALQAIKDEKNTKYVGNLNILISAIVGNELLITQCGDAEAYLVRKRLLSNISEGLTDEQSGDVFTNIASGTLESGDFVIFNSTRLLRYISKNDLARVCSGRNIVSVLAELKDVLATEVVGRVGVTGVMVQESVPVVSDFERNRIFSHLIKEEMGVTAGASVGERAPRREVDVQNQQEKARINALQNMVATLGRTVGSLKQQVSGLTKSGSGRSLIDKGASFRASLRQPAANGGWSRQKMMVSGGILVLLLIVGVWWLNNRAAEQQAVEKYSTMLNEVRESISSAETTGQYNKDQAAQMLNQAQSKALEVLNSGYSRAKANELLQSIQDTRDRLDGVVHPAYKVMADLTQKRANVSALGMVGVKDKLYAFEYNALYQILLDKVQDPLTIDENESVVAASYYDDKNSILFYTKAGKVIEYRDGRMAFVDSVDGKFKPGVDVKSYSNSFYVLDSADNQIFKYVRRREKFDTAATWGVGANVKNAVSFAIDGSIYVLNKDGSVDKYFNGNKVKFDLRKLPTTPLTSPTRIFTELDLNQIYILEPSTKRVLVFAKDDKNFAANYVTQYVFDDLKDLKDLYVDKDTNKMYLLDSSKVYTVNL